MNSSWPIVTWIELFRKYKLNMEIEKLIKMANQIGDFFEAYPDDEDAKKGIANHLHNFWNSIMINSIVTHVKQKQGVGLHHKVIEAIQQHIA